MPSFSRLPVSKPGLSGADRRSLAACCVGRDLRTEFSKSSKSVAVGGNRLGPEIFLDLHKRVCLKPAGDAIVEMGTNLLCSCSVELTI